MVSAPRKKPEVAAAKSAKKRHTFALDAPQARDVFVAGTFNNWNPEEYALKRNRQGVWGVTLSLATGTYEYRFVVDGDWREDPACPHLSQNAFGTHNSLLAL